jgi:DNA replication protein DnaC
MLKTTCEQCDGLGLVRTAGGSRPCPGCQETERHRAMIARSRIPAGYLDARISNFKITPTTQPAAMMARRFVHDFVPGVCDPKQPGLMFTGSVGTGKTHLAVGILRELIETKGIYGRFVDVRQLLDQLRSSYDDDAKESQAQILKPLLTADLVVIDELGAARSSEWVFETIELLIGGLYNRATPVIVTTNLANLGAGQSSSGNEYTRAMRQETLGDRIGARMFSRLQQMCVSVDMTGPDWRGKR